MLETLARRQEAYRAIIRDLRDGETDATFTERAALAIDTRTESEEAMVAVATVLFEVSAHKEDRIPQENDVFFAFEFVDHLSTLGWELRRKE